MECKLNINYAAFDELASLPGVGPNAAQAILEFRQVYGQLFPEDLLTIPHIKISPILWTMVDFFEDEDEETYEDTFNYNQQLSDNLSKPNDRQKLKDLQNNNMQYQLYPKPPVSHPGKYQYFERSGDIDLRNDQYQSMKRTECTHDRNRERVSTTKNYLEPEIPQHYATRSDPNRYIDTFGTSRDMYKTEPGYTACRNDLPATPRESPYQLSGRRSEKQHNWSTPGGRHRSNLSPGYIESRNDLPTTPRESPYQLSRPHRGAQHNWSTPGGSNRSNLLKEGIKEMDKTRKDKNRYHITADELSTDTMNAKRERVGREDLNSMFRRVEHSDKVPSIFWFEAIESNISQDKLNAKGEEKTSALAEDNAHKNSIGDVDNASNTVVGDHKQTSIKDRKVKTLLEKQVHFTQKLDDMHLILQERKTDISKLKTELENSAKCFKELQNKSADKEKELSQKVIENLRSLEEKDRKIKNLVNEKKQLLNTIKSKEENISQLLRSTQKQIKYKEESFRKSQLELEKNEIERKQLENHLRLVTDELTTKQEEMREKNEVNIKLKHDFDSKLSQLRHIQEKPKLKEEQLAQLRQSVQNREETRMRFPEECTLEKPTEVLVNETMIQTTSSIDLKEEIVKNEQDHIKMEIKSENLLLKDKVSSILPFDHVIFNLGVNENTPSVESENNNREVLDRCDPETSIKTPSVFRFETTTSDDTRKILNQEHDEIFSDFADVEASVTADGNASAKTYEKTSCTAENCASVTADWYAFAITDEGASASKGDVSASADGKASSIVGCVASTADEDVLATADKSVSATDDEETSDTAKEVESAATDEKAISTDENNTSATIQEESSAEDYVETSADHNENTSADDKAATSADDNEEILDDKETSADDNEKTSANGNQNTLADDNKLTSADGNKEMNVDEHDGPSAVNDEKTSADDHEETPFTDVYSTDDEQVTIKHTSLACDIQGEMVLNEQPSIKSEMNPNVTNVSDKDVVLKQGLELIIAHPAEVVSSNPEEVSVEDKLDLDDFIEVELSNNTEVVKHMEQQTQITTKCFAKEEQHLSEVLRASVVKPSTFNLDTSTMLGRKHYGSVRWCMDSCAVNAATEKDLYTVRTEPDIEGNVFNAHGDVTPLERQKSSDASTLQAAECSSGALSQQDEPSEMNVYDDDLPPSDQPSKKNERNEGRSVGMSDI